MPEWCDDCKEYHEEGTHANTIKLLAICERWSGWLKENRDKLRVIDLDEIDSIPVPELIAAALAALIKSEKDPQEVFDRLCSICGEIFVTGRLIEMGIEFKAREPIPDVFYAE